MGLLLVSQHVVLSGELLPAHIAFGSWVWDVVLLGVRLVIDPVVTVHVTPLGLALVAQRALDGSDVELHVLAIVAWSILGCM